VLWFDGQQWHPVKVTHSEETRKDAFNRVEFEPVVAAALRLEVKLRVGYSAGILEWRVGE
jgi:hypothetical protein